MQLSRKVPARTKTVKFRWVYKNWMCCNEKYRQIRGKHSRGSMLKCDWCGHKFEDDEMFGLASPMPKQEGPKRNWALCNACAEKMGCSRCAKKKSPHNSALSAESKAQYSTGVGGYTCWLNRKSIATVANNTFNSKSTSTWMETTPYHARTVATNTTASLAIEG